MKTEGEDPWALPCSAAFCPAPPPFQAPQLSLTLESQAPLPWAASSLTQRTANNARESCSKLEEVRFNCHQKVWAQMGMDKCPAEPPPFPVLSVPLHLPPVPLRAVVGPPCDLIGALLLLPGAPRGRSSSDCPPGAVSLRPGFPPPDFAQDLLPWTPALPALPLRSILIAKLEETFKGSTARRVWLSG